MQVCCPECQADILADDVNIVKTIAVCKSCNNIFEFSEQLYADDKRFPAPLFNERSTIIPPGIEVLRLSSELEIMVKWRKSVKYFLPFFALIWNTAIFFFCMIVILSGAWGGLVFLVPFILIGVWLIYASVGYLLNTSYILVDEKSLRIEHKPINFLAQKDKNYKIEEIEQLYVKRKLEGTNNDVPVYSFSVHIKLQTGKDILLVKRLRNVEYAQFIEQEIEHYLGIKDRSVSGEWSVKE